MIYYSRAQSSHRYTYIYILDCDDKLPLLLSKDLIRISSVNPDSLIIIPVFIVARD